MQDETHYLMPTLLEVGNETLNVRYLIRSRKVGDPDPASAVEVWLETGMLVRFEGDQARDWIGGLTRFICPPLGPLVRGQTKVLRRRQGPAKDRREEGG